MAADQILDTILRRLGAPGQGKSQTTAESLMRTFLRMSPPQFDGRGEPEAASRWLDDLEVEFEGLACTPTERTRLAVMQLTGSARDWWHQDTTKTLESEIAEMPRDDFAARFLENYFSKVKE